ncbi:hypothetical protein PWR63_01265 [Paraburkholderia sp. A2WS-5]|uniref:hypothetical protein n=1 Tax=unclassified Paraburkholderia TaxID=2615204 RepID=UPI003B7DC236
MAGIHLLRAFAEFFPSRPPVAAPAARPSPSRPRASEIRTVGQGAPNETFVFICGVPNLFVDEGDCIVQFSPAFEEGPRDTCFGTKILPEPEPHWSLVSEHRASLKDAIATAIRAEGKAQGLAATAQARSAPAAEIVHEIAGHAPDHADAHDVATAPRQPRERVPRRDDRGAATVGRVLGWGEEQFPSRKPQGKPFYTSFAMHIDTLSGERTLQGEGLKDAIAQSGCRVGDVVTLRRLEKIQVPAFTDSGRPIMKNGQQVLWDKWLWSITR